MTQDKPKNPQDWIKEGHPTTRPAEKEKNPAAVAMAKLRAASLTPERRSEIARQGGTRTKHKRTKGAIYMRKRRAKLAAAKPNVTTDEKETA